MLYALEALDEKHRDAHLHMYAMQVHRKSYYNIKSRPKQFKEGNLVLLYNS